MDGDRIPTQESPTPAGPCRPGSHADPVPFGEHVQLGLVPSRSATIIGALLVAAVGWVVTLLPTAVGTVVLIGALLGVVIDVAIQLSLGHRGRCLVRRSVRWAFGSIGSVIDPFDWD